MLDKNFKKINFTIKKIMFQMNKTAKIRILVAIWKSQKKA